MPATKATNQPDQSGSRAASTVPKVGQFTYCRGVACRIVEVYPYGTMKVQGIENNALCFIVSGLPFTAEDLK